VAEVRAHTVCTYGCSSDRHIVPGYPSSLRSVLFRAVFHPACGESLELSLKLVPRANHIKNGCGRPDRKNLRRKEGVCHLVGTVFVSSIPYRNIIYSVKQHETVPFLSLLSPPGWCGCSLFSSCDTVPSSGSCRRRKLPSFLYYSRRRRQISLVLSWRC